MKEKRKKRGIGREVVLSRREGEMRRDVTRRGEGNRKEKERGGEKRGAGWEIMWRKEK
jgi:hypothetical protein